MAGKDVGKSMGKDLPSMMKKAPSGKGSDPKKKFGMAQVLKKPCGFGKQQSQGLKKTPLPVPTQYGSA